MSSQRSEHPLVRLLEQPVKYVVGLMSGTSVDGIDAALCAIEGHGAAARVRLVDFRTTPFSDQQRARIHSLFRADTATLCQANFELGQWLADAALAIAKGKQETIDLVGSHGQTVWHHPPSHVLREGGTASTLQLGEPSLIAARTGAVTVGDFRVADIVAGGEGAPLVPFADWVLYRQPGRARAVQNIGGIANVALLVDDFDGLVAFDNGPGNMMVDALMPLASNGSDTIDRDGSWSARGTVQEDWWPRSWPIPTWPSRRRSRPAASATAPSSAARGPRSTPIASRSISSPPPSRSRRAPSPTAIAAFYCRADRSTTSASPAAARTTRR
jgi:anhydro-N-acetylmuramic acid kinase